MRIRPILVLVVLLLAGCRIDGTASPAPDGWAFVSEQPCAETTASGADDFSCVTLSVPVDHARPAGEHWDVTFGVHRAEGERRGVFVTSTGGPGSSGLDLAEAYSTEFPDELWRDFDVVFFDQRGIGLSQEFRCDDTYYDYYAFVDSSSSAGDRDAFAQDSTRFGEECFAEAGVDPATAPRYATAQAVEDLEDFRQWLDAPQLVLYGESYGTQYAQTYAAAHPDRVERLVLDGVVDLTTDQTAFAVQQAEGISAVLEATLARCDADPACAAAAPGDSLADYDALLDQLAADPVTPPGGGYPVDDYTLRDAASSSMSSPYDREDFTDALNQALNGEVAGLDALGNSASGPTADFSDALYLAVECQDYDFVPAGGDPRAALDDWLGVAASAGVDDLRLSYYYGDEDCLFWPGSTTDPDFARPEPVTDPPYPVLVLNSDTDPNTPFVGARAVFGRLVPDAGPADAAIIQRYGPHVIYGWGDPCVDDPVHTFVETGELPAQRVTLCTW